jgi:tetratricopeptide (TPR) repeat protein
MKMKKILFIAMFFGTAIGISSCKKDITLNPPSGVTIDAYFKNQKDITASLAGIYSAFQEEMVGDGSGKDEGYGGRYHYWGDVRGDQFAASTYATYSVVEMYNNTLEFSNSAADWTGLYKVIGRANLGIQYYPQVPSYDPNVTPTILNNSLAQAYAMRAEAYFYIVRNWGDAPLFTTAYTDITVSGSKPRTKAITLIDSVIIPDLTKAYSLIQKQQTPVVWYINEGAICAIMADVYMWRASLPNIGSQADYQNAITWYKKLFTTKNPLGAAYGGTAAGIETTANWKNPFLNPANSPEGIWSMYWDYTINGCACIPVFVGLSNNPVQLDPNFQANFKRGYKTDTRVAKSIDTLNTLNHINMLYKYYNLTPTASGITPSTTIQNYNVYLPMYRLSDIYLSLAEAYAQTDDLPDALTYLNYIYVRARQINASPTIPNIPATQYPTQASMVDGILAESQFELLGEGKRWYDLVRMGRVHQIMDPILNLRNATSVTVNGVTTITLDTKGFQDAPNRYLWPVSQSALNANKLLVQNPGY